MDQTDDVQSCFIRGKKGHFITDFKRSKKNNKKFFKRQLKDEKRYFKKKKYHKVLVDEENQRK